MPETALSRSPVYSARPSVRVGGQADERIDNQLLALTLEEQDGGLGALELRLSNWVATRAPAGGTELAFDASSRLKLGCELSVSAGDTSAPQPLFTGRVSALEFICDEGQPPELVVLAEDALNAARRARRSQTYVNQSPADVVRQVASRLGLSPNITGLNAPTTTWVQLDETDLGFLRRLVGRLDGDLQIIDGRLVVAPLTDGRPGVIELALHGQLQRVRISADLADQVTAVSVAGWSASDGQAVQGQASSLDQPGPGQGRSGPDWAREAFGERRTHLATPAVCSGAEARAVATAAFDQRARRFVRAEGQAQGNPALRVGCQLRLSGLSPQFDNTYRVLRTCHRYDLQQGYRTEFSAECAFLG